MSESKWLEAQLPPPPLISPLRSPRPLVMDDIYTIDSASDKISPLSKSAQSFDAKPWPERPQKLYKGHGGYRYWDSTIDVVFLLLPIPFFMLAIAVISVSGRKVDDYELEVLQEAIRGATTVFPICFAAIAGRAGVKYATWKLEKGTTLGILEQLMGSRTVASAITTQIQLRSFNLVGLGLVLIWCLSPLGSQSVLHILFTPQKPISVISDVSYFNSRQQSYSAPSGSFQNQWYPTFTILMGASLLSPASIKNSTMDMWGNVRIPYFPGNLSNPKVAASTAWTPISDDSSNIQFSSLFGIPMSGVGMGNTTVNVESSYLQLTCTDFVNSTQQEQAPGNRTQKNDQISTNGPFLTTQNATLQTPWAIGYKGQDIAAVGASLSDTFVYPKSCPDCLPSDYLNRTFDSGTLLFQEYDGDFGIISITCTPSQIYLESRVFCETTATISNCAVVAQRPSQLPHMDPAITYLSFPPVAMGLTALLPNSTPTAGAANQIQGYLYDPHSVSNIANSQLSVFQQPGDISPLFNLSLPDFGQRLGQIINTYLLASTWNFTTVITEGSVIDITAYPTGGNGASFVPATKEDLVAMIQNQTAAFTIPADLANSIPIYAAFYPWLFIFILSNSVMMAAAIAGVWYSRRTIVPDYLGFVSSLAKESPYIRMPDVGVNMDGMDKARLVKEVKVRLGDVSGRNDVDAGVGRLAFARMGETRRVRKGMLYV